MGLKFFLAGAQDIKSSLRGAKLPNGQPLNDDNNDDDYDNDRSANAA